jgi:hypothetical protein
MLKKLENHEKVKVCIISDVEGMKKIEHLWNAFISEHCGYPFLLSGFVNQLLRPNSRNLKMRILVFFVADKIVGVVPLQIRDELFHSVRFHWLPSDPVSDPRYTRAVLRETLLILFRKWGRHMAVFTLTPKSQYLHVLKEVCRELGIAFSYYPISGRAIVPVKGSWIEFEQGRRKLRREFERTGRRMREMGQLKVDWFGNGDNQAEVYKKILEVETASWKSTDQPSEKLKIDPSILLFLNGFVQTSLAVPKFNWGVAFLELNGIPIAHSMFLEYNGEAYICKTSFNDRYRKQGPGIYINHLVVRKLMSKNEVKVIDFITDVPFSHKWASEVVPINRFIMLRKGMGLLYLIRDVLPTSIPKLQRRAKYFNKLVSILKTKIT